MTAEVVTRPISAVTALAMLALVLFPVVAGWRRRRRGARAGA